MHHCIFDAMNARMCDLVFQCLDIIPLKSVLWLVFLTKAYSNYLLFYCPCRYIYLLSPNGIVKECKDQVTKLKE